MKKKNFIPFFKKMETGMLPQKWMGHKILPVLNVAGCDIDYEWQVPIVEHWLKEIDIND